MSTSSGTFAGAAYETVRVGEGRFAEVRSGDATYFSTFEMGGCATGDMSDSERDGECSGIARVVGDRFSRLR